MKKQTKKSTKKEKTIPRKYSPVPKDKGTGVPKKYLSGAKNRSAKAQEIMDTAERYRKGLPIDVKKVSKSRVDMAKKYKPNPMFAKGKKNGKGKKSK